jgi:hypothetical protein
MFDLSGCVLSWSVVIPSAKAENLCKAVASVLRSHPGLPRDRVYVVDDGARRDAETGISQGICWIEGVKPFVYSRNVNLGVEASAPHHVVIMGDDVEVEVPGIFDFDPATLSILTS